MNLAFNLRPKNLKEFFGQEHLVGEGKLLRRLVEQKQLSSMIFWGPPGSGKTTLAQIIAKATSADFHGLSAVTAGKDDLLKIVQMAREKLTTGQRTILFIDEIHRWNKAQQDALLPYVESGLITLIGASTENPSFEVISALLSRCRIFVLQGLGVKDLEKILARGLGVSKRMINKDAQELLIRLSGGDARIMLNAVELATQTFSSRKFTVEHIQEIFQTKVASIYDKKADEHYNTISAFIKSVRGSDPDAALYYLCRMLENGEDPKFIARRLIILASEDIGLTDRGALIQANSAFEAVQKIGMPEAGLVLAHVTIYLARAAKSRMVANALEKAKEAVLDFPNEPIPLHLRNAPTKLMKELGYARDYVWGQERVGPSDDRSFLPEKLKGMRFLDEIKTPNATNAITKNKE